MEKIRNLKTSKSFKQKQDYITSLRTKKKFFLNLTDWTQLYDVSVSNFEEITSWRKKLREFNIPDDADHNTEISLDALIQSIPDIGNVQSADPVPEYIEPVPSSTPVEVEVEQENLEEDILLDEKQAREFARTAFAEYKNQRLLDNGILEYNMMRVLLEEAIDSQTEEQSDSSLFSQCMEKDTSSREVIENCKEYFKNINGLYATLSKEQRSLYNMSIKQLNEWFKNNGYRYRCYDKD